MEVRFWGVRGSVAVSGEQVAWVGGNTSCLEVGDGEHRLILDAGTGIRGLGDALMAAGRPVKAALFFSHLHWDHVQGFPFFAPAYAPSTELLLHGPGPAGDVKLHRVLSRQMRPPSFPVTLEAMRARMTFAVARAGEPVQHGPFTVTPFALPHPNGCLGYRVESGGRSFVYATDVELSVDRLTPQIIGAMKGCDALCLDAQYTPDEYHGRVGIPKKGWGHSTMVDAAQIAREVGARRLFLFHHDPAHNDDVVRAMAEEARGHFPEVEPAREGHRIAFA
ncbi:MAG TPA: MBL fold metallo-hydrolase [Myxococcales bacterium]|nr:MBL fold metallo-hydrolase [Myxococcales bacterium]